LGRGKEGKYFSVEKIKEREVPISRAEKEKGSYNTLISRKTMILIKIYLSVFCLREKRGFPRGKFLVRGVV